MNAHSRALLVVAVAAAACTSGPDWQPQERKTPNAFASADAAFPVSAPVAAWWTQLHSPQLDALVQDALAGNLEVRAVIARLHAARANAGLSDDALLPSLDGTGSYRRTRNTEATPNPLRGRQYDTWTLGFDASWELDLFGRLRREHEAAVAEFAASTADAQALRLLLIAEVTAAFADLQGASQRRTIAEGSVAAATELLTLTKAREGSGFGTALDVARAERLLATTRARLPGFERDARRAAFRLAVLTARTPGDLAPALQAAATLPAVPDVVAIGLPAELVRARPDVAAAEHRLHAATARVGAALAERWPSLSLTGFFGLEANHPNDVLRGSSNAWHAGPAVRVPLFTGGRVADRIAIREAEVDEAALALEQQVLAAFEEVENAVTALQQERRRAGELVQALDAAQRACTLAQQRFEAGLVDFLAVLEAEQARLDIADQHAAVATELVRQFAALHKALGTRDAAPHVAGAE